MKVGGAWGREMSVWERVRKAFKKPTEEQNQLSEGAAKVPWLDREDREVASSCQ